jgi:serine/threonine-protein kinase
VSFYVITPWTRPWRDVAAGAQTAQRVAQVTLILILAVAIGGGIFFARRNLMSGRGDRRGASRLAAFVLILLSLQWILGEHHVATLWELGLFLSSAGTSLLNAALLGVVYLAFEPFVRRRWPNILVSWTRLISGDWRDPLVGRDILAGCAAAGVLACTQRIRVLSPAWFDYAGEMPVTADLNPLTGPG